MQKTIQKAGGLLIRDRKVMLERHGGKDIYIIPGGKLEAGETAKEALIRELREEFTISVQPEDLTPLGTFSAQAVHRPDAIVTIEAFLIEKWNGEIVLNDDIEGVLWVNSQTISIVHVSDIAKEFIIPLLKEKGIID